MNDEREQRIRERAHQIWESEARPDGQDQSHWERALREIEVEERAKTSSAAERASDAPNQTTSRHLAPAGRTLEM